jgi:putative Holliday junction resolvase
MNPPVLAVDPGEARLGIAVSDPTGTIARPFLVVRHSSRAQDAEQIAHIADEQQAGSILVGLALDHEGRIGPQGRKAVRLVEALRAVTSLPVEMWDESGSTLAARRGERDDGLLDARAAAVFLQDFLDAQAA